MKGGSGRYAVSVHEDFLPHLPPNSLLDDDGH